MSGEHGTRSSYTHHHCRCAPCTQANTDYQRGYMWEFRRQPEVIARRQRPEVKERRREYDRARYKRQQQEKAAAAATASGANS